MQLVNIHTHSVILDSNSIDVVQLELSSQVIKWGSVGVHPWDSETSNVTIAELDEFLKLNPQVWLGEIGVDRVRNVDIKTQCELFEEQFKLAEKYKRPVIVHNVKASSDILQICTKIKPSVPIIFHASNISMQQIMQLLEYNCYFSFGINQLLIPKNQEVFKKLPLNKIFFETDTADVLINQVYDLGANILALRQDYLEQQVFANFNTVLEVFNNNQQ